MTDNAYDPAEALASVRASQARLARVTPCPPWRHVAFAAIFALLIGSIVISLKAQFIAMPLVIAAVLFLVQNDRKRYGMFINGYRRGRTLPVTLTFLGVMLVMVLAAVHLRENGFGDVSKIALTALAFALAAGFSVAWQRVYIDELTRGEA